MVKSDRRDVLGQRKSEGKMADCPHMPECAFYHDKLDNMPPTAEFMKMVFCHKKSETCARYIALNHSSTKKVPDWLMPHEINKVEV